MDIRGIQSPGINNYFKMCDLAEDVKTQLETAGFTKDFRTHADSRNSLTDFYHSITFPRISAVAQFCIDPDTINTEDLPRGAMRGYRFAGLISITNAHSEVILSIDHFLERSNKISYCFDPQYEKVIFEKELLGSK